ncbi:MAG: biotin--[acetyl-CoA-carboxylase] ligase, partial [Megasphaera micronuciformis]
GINTSFTRDELPADLQDKATSFLIEGVTVGRNELWQAVMEELERYYEMAKHEGFSCILDEWRSLSVTLNQDVEIVKTQGVTYGKAVDIDDDGNLIVVGPDGPVRIVAGDVRIRPKK